MAVVNYYTWVRYKEIQLKTAVKAYLNKKYPTVTVSDQFILKDTPTFPFVQVRLLESPEQGQVLEKDEINAILATVQVTVNSNKSEDECREISDYIASKLTVAPRFSMVTPAMPDFDSTNNIYSYTARYRRMIGANDNITW